MKTLFLINARSGARRKWSVEEAIRGHCVTEYDIAPCQRKEDLDDILTRAEASGFEVICAVGGDGTVHEIGKRLAGRQLALAILPTGSGNGFARHFGIPLTPSEAITLSGSGRIVEADVADVDDTRFIGNMGLGFDALIAHRFAESTTRGMKTYVQLGMRSFLDYRAGEYEIEVDGERLTRRAFVVAVANTREYGNGAKIAPQASVEDGLLDLVLIDKVGFAGAMMLLPRLFNGTLDRAGNVTTRRGSHIVIRRAAAGPAHMDGEPVMLGETIDIRVKPRALRVVAPRGIAPRGVR